MDTAASPADSASANRGGRPREWTDDRMRRLTRLYLYTSLPFKNILDLLEDGVWKPGKDAANKVKNNLLGNDPRWMRPKDLAEEKLRISALKSSRRAEYFPRRNNAQQTGNSTGPPEPLDGVTLSHSFQVSFEKAEESGVSWPGTGMNYYPGQHGQEAFPVYDEATFSMPFAAHLNRRNSFRQDTGLTTSTQISTTSTIRQKLASLPANQAKNALRVLKQFTFPKNTEPSRPHSVSPIPGHIPNILSSVAGSSLFDDSTSRDLPDARHIVAGDFLLGSNIARDQCSLGSPSHASRRCWCRINEESSSHRAPWTSFIPQELHDRYYSARDEFGNTAFHHLAALEQPQEYVLRLVAQALMQPRIPIREKNTAGQTFLHVLHRLWDGEGSLLGRLINMLQHANFDLSATDVYGRTFLHGKPQYCAQFIGQPTDQSFPALNCRDAFGIKPLQIESPTPQTSGQITPGSTTMRRLSSADTIISTRTAFSPARLTIPTYPGGDARYEMNSGLLRIVRNAVQVDDDVDDTRPNPRSEDFLGRNGFHCLAEADLDLQSSESPLTPNSRRQRKRKYSEEEETPQSPQTPQTARHNKRLEFLEGLLKANVDVNHYDKQGSTPLMAFIAYARDESRYDKDDLDKTIRRLVQGGAKLEARNRQGETALHLAAKTGLKFAVKILLELGANPHVRNARGMGILEVLDEEYLQTEHDIPLQARLESCRAILTGRGANSAVQKPTVRDEWTWIGSRVSSPR